ncbi:hypothetical protein [Methylosinus sp. LW4]|uniref:hypothetical protein n=1 Tax=Methylosinus sp. LW4 TaxID=136993 RepID=UPI0003698FDC|nr:hypothetical protein [Methylosinus sp. LW4]
MDETTESKTRTVERGTTLASDAEDNGLVTPSSTPDARFHGVKYRQIFQRLAPAATNSTRSLLNALLNRSPIDDIETAFIYAPFIFAMSFVLSIGPLLQKFVLALFYSDSASIYSSLYQEALGSFPSIENWLIVGLDWRFLLLATGITAFSLCRTAPQDVFRHACIASFAGLCVLDVFSATVEQNFTVQFAVENLIMNLLGAFAISLIVLLLAVAYNIIFSVLSARAILRRLVSAFPIATSGVIVSAVVYYLGSFVYKPIPAHITAILSTPISGTAIHDNRSQESQSGTRHATPPTDDVAFQFLPQDIRDGSLSWRGVDSPMSAHWQRRTNTAEFNIAVELFADCIGDSIDSAKSNSANVIHLNNVNDLSLKFDIGSVNIFTPASDTLKGKLHLDSKSYFYWMKKSADQKAVEYTQLVQRDAKLEFSPTSGAAFYISAELLGAKGDAVSPKPRALAIQADDQSFAFSITPDVRRNGDKKLICRSISPTKTTGDTLASHPTAVIGALVRIKSVHTGRTYRPNASNITFSDGDGWITVRTDEAKFSHDGFGILNFISFRGDVSQLAVDNAIIATHLSDSYVAAGRFEVSFHGANQVRIAGKAYALWKNAKRLNSTKWETLDEKTALALSSALGGLFLWLLARCVLILRANNALDALIVTSRQPTPSMSPSKDCGVNH